MDRLQVYSLKQTKLHCNHACSLLMMMENVTWKSTIHSIYAKNGCLRKIDRWIQEHALRYFTATTLQIQIYETKN